jgi:hypothetical protein
MKALIAFAGILVGVLTTLAAQWASHKRSLQLTAAEKRLAAQQEAFAVWWRLATNYHKEEKRNEYGKECQKFWANNCLYLGKKSRPAFKEALLDVMCYEMFNDGGPQKMKELGAVIENVFHILMEEADLPNVNESFIDIPKLIEKAQKQS